MYRPLSASLAALLLLTMTSGLAAQAGPKSPTPAAAQANEPAKAAQETATEIDLRLRAETAERNEAIAAAKADVIEAGNSRLENWIAIYGILIAVMLAAFGFATFRRAATAARDEVKSLRIEIETMRNEAQAIRDEARTLRDSAKSHAGEIEQTRDQVRELSDELKARVQQTPGTALESPLPAEEKAELDRATDSIESVPRGDRTAQDFRLLMLRAQQQGNWDEYVALAEGMAYLHGDKPNDLAFALFGKAVGDLKLKNYEMSASLWEYYFRRCPDDNHDNRAYGFNNWGNALSNQAKSKQGDAADALFGQAGEKYAAALAIKPDKHEALNNWGAALTDQARTKQGDAADALFAQAGEKYAAALVIKPDDHEALNNWGTALSAQARTKQGDVADALFGQAGEKYAAALAIKPDDHEALYNWGTALLAQAGTKRGDAANALFAQAEEKLNKSEALKPGWATYNLACLHGLRGNAAGAAKWLRTAKQLDANCPDCAHIAADKDFDTVRDTPEFIAALTDIGCPPPA